MFHEEALYQVYLPLPLPLFDPNFNVTTFFEVEYLKKRFILGTKLL